MFGYSLVKNRELDKLNNKIMDLEIKYESLDNKTIGLSSSINHLEEIVYNHWKEEVTRKLMEQGLKGYLVKRELPSGNYYKFNNFILNGNFIIEITELNNNAPYKFVPTELEVHKNFIKYEHGSTNFLDLVTFKISRIPKRS